jgi:hypothetical protein
LREWWNDQDGTKWDGYFVGSLFTIFDEKAVPIEEIMADAC